VTTRRWLALLLVTAVALASGEARAQIPMIANGIVHATNATVNAANTTTETLLYQYPIPAALIASWTSSNTAFAATPLHLRLNGSLVTNSTTGLGGGVGAATLGVNLGGSLATMMVVNGLLPDNLGRGPLGAAPVGIDVWISPIATVTTQNCTDLRPCNVSLYMSGKFTTASITGVNAATEITSNAVVLGTINVLQGQTLNVLWRWASAASSNSLNIYSGVLKLGY
jgi:hypothetical protein